MTLRLSVCLLAVSLLATAAVADWDPGDPHKMHFPQLPDPQGWDVLAAAPRVLADDWRCSQTGPVTDVHFWGSWLSDEVAEIERIHISIHEDDPSPPYSRPGDLLWERDFYPGDWTERLDGTGAQGWYDPFNQTWNKPDHINFYQYNIVDIFDPFFQQEGTIYWLDISVSVKEEDDVIRQWGWKTSLNHYNDDAVWGTYPDPNWGELRDPITNESLDMAFVITPEPAGILMIMIGLLVIRRR